MQNRGNYLTAASMSEASILDYRGKEKKITIINFHNRCVMYPLKPNSYLFLLRVQLYIKT
jgi:hypothetical protein